MKFTCPYCSAAEGEVHFAECPSARTDVGMGNSVGCCAECGNSVGNLHYSTCERGPGVVKQADRDPRPQPLRTPCPDCGVEWGQIHKEHPAKVPPQDAIRSAADLIGGPEIVDFFRRLDRKARMLEAAIAAVLGTPSDVRMFMADYGGSGHDDWLDGSMTPRQVLQWALDKARQPQ